MLVSGVSAHTIFGVISLERGVNVGQRDLHRLVEERMPSLDGGPSLQLPGTLCHQAGIKSRLPCGSGEQPEDGVQAGFASKPPTNGIFLVSNPIFFWRW